MKPLFALALLLLLPGCTVGYVLGAGAHQLELLASRQPVDKVLAKGALDDQERASLALVADVKRFGQQVGLEDTRNYDTLAVGWDKHVWVVTGCEPLSFTAKTRWFPIVGRVSYLGFFNEDAARREQRKLEKRGYEVHVRTAGAWSTLGWFRDPILPDMLRWTTLDLADTVLHELAHATVWIPGSVSFNESFASFVGEEAAIRYLVDRFGERSPEVTTARSRIEDTYRWRALLHQVYVDLDAVYNNASLTDPDKIIARERVLAGMPARVEAGGFEVPEPFLRAASDRGAWNNARLVEHRTYNSRREVFQAVLDRNNGDLRAFMGDVERIARGGREDPFVALERAAGVAAAPHLDSGS